MCVRVFVCVYEYVRESTALPGRPLVEAHSSGEMLSKQHTVLFYCLLLQLAVFFLAAGAPRGEIWRGMQQEDVR